MKRSEMRQHLSKAYEEGRQTPAFYALGISVIPSVLQVEDGPEGLEEIKTFLADIGMPESYAYPLRSLMKVQDELHLLDYLLVEAE